MSDTGVIYVKREPGLYPTARISESFRALWMVMKVGHCESGVPVCAFPTEAMAVEHARRLEVAELAIYDKPSEPRHWVERLVLWDHLPTVKVIRETIPPRQPWMRPFRSIRVAVGEG